MDDMNTTTPAHECAKCENAACQDGHGCTAETPMCCKATADEAAPSAM